MSIRSALKRWGYGMPFPDALVYRFVASVFYWTGRTFWRYRLDGLEKVPSDEPFLLLPNHSSLLDPFWVGTPVPRGVKAMASATVMSVPYLGRLLSMCGAFAKMKYTKDRGAMQMLQKQFDDGYGILLFPEGNRSWTGENLAVLPGIGRLIKRLGCKVVYARINSAYLVQPRWANYQRWVPVEITYDGPYEYGEHQTAEEITAHVADRIALTPHLKKPARTFGFRMAYGLENLLWACPGCFEMDRTLPDPANGNHLLCRACDVSWRVDVECRLHGPSTSMTVAEAWAGVENHFGSPPVADRVHFEASGIALSAPRGKVELIPRGRGKKPECVADGVVEVRKDGLHLSGGSTDAWSLGHDILRGISMDMGNQLHFRVDAKLYRLTVEGQSPLKWAHFLRGWKQSPAA